jgi:DNA polymerase III subunit delta'
MKLTYNWKIAGHSGKIAELEKEILENRLSHAYLFAGPEQVGKYTVAKTMAGIVQCPNGYCHECPTCREIEKGYHADTIEVTDNGESIKVDEVRDLLTKLNMSRTSARKIMLIQNVERMTIESANAMLKTLEDPPEGVMFLMTTGRLREILPTIISRVRLYTFQRLPERKILELLQSLYPLAETDMLEQVALYALGRPGRAVKFMAEPELLEEARKMYNEIGAFVKKPDRMAEFAYAEQIASMMKERESDKPLNDFLDTFTAVLRDKMLEQDDGAARTKTLRLLGEVQQSRDLVKRNVNTKLLLENLMLQL